MYCRNCGKPIPDDAEFCPDCGIRLRDPSVTYLEVYDSESEEKKQKVRVEPPSEQSESRPRKSAVLAAVLSVVPGLGHLYLGRVTGGVLNLVIFGFLNILMTDLPGLIVLPLMQVFFCMYDCVRTVYRE